MKTHIILFDVQGVGFLDRTFDSLQGHSKQLDRIDFYCLDKSSIGTPFPAELSGLVKIRKQIHVDTIGKIIYESLYECTSDLLLFLRAGDLVSKDWFDKVSAPNTDEPICLVSSTIDESQFSDYRIRTFDSAGVAKQLFAGGRFPDYWQMALSKAALERIRSSNKRFFTSLRETLGIELTLFMLSLDIEIRVADGLAVNTGVTTELRPEEFVRKAGRYLAEYQAFLRSWFDLIPIEATAHLFPLDTQSVDRNDLFRKACLASKAPFINLIGLQLEATKRRSSMEETAEFDTTLAKVSTLVSSSFVLAFDEPGVFVLIYRFYRKIRYRPAAMFLLATANKALKFMKW